MKFKLLLQENYFLYKKKNSDNKYPAIYTKYSENDLSKIAQLFKNKLNIEIDTKDIIKISDSNYFKHKDEIALIQDNTRSMRKDANDLLSAQLKNHGINLDSNEKLLVHHIDGNEGNHSLDNLVGIVYNKKDSSLPNGINYIFENNFFDLLKNESKGINVYFWKFDNGKFRKYVFNCNVKPCKE